ncbi:NB-ARC domain-containing protein [Ditylenchus destructor]|uniref:NB-ARC domain-containing protein n=1 Tax=Ditylenchus destructor TaxID=166010 RepID=A0AAD4NG38_9BILA|nr:NB-ARC domain-containing protein [Ditylenchus destructor]
MSIGHVDCEQQEFILRRGHVPARKHKRIHRRPLMDDLAHQINKLTTSESANWLVLHGMPGVGKSQLLVDVLWEWPEIVFEQFKRIFWIDDRNTNPENLVDVATDALILVSDYMDEVQLPENLVKIGISIRTALDCIAPPCSDSKVLLILDGAMLPDTVRFFDTCKTKNCCVIATSNSEEIFSLLEDVTYFHLNCNDGLNENELMQKATLYGLHITSKQAKNLLKLSGGNLAMLDKVLQIAQGNAEILPALLHRLQFRPLSELNKLSEYHYPTMEIPISLCFRMIDKRIAYAFDHWTVFEPFKWTSLEVLKLCWPMDLCGLETEEEIRGMLLQDLKVLVRNSLLDEKVFETNDENEHDKNWCYIIHPLIRSYLLHNRSNSYSNFKKSMDSLLEKLQENAEYNERVKEFCDKNLDNLRDTDKAFSLMLNQKSSAMVCIKYFINEGIIKLFRSIILVMRLEV